MDWFDWRLSKASATDRAAVLNPQAILRELDKRVPQYLDDADEGKLIYPACKRNPSDAHGDVRSIWDHTRVQTAVVSTSAPAILQQAPALVAEAQLSAPLPTPAAAAIKIERKKTKVAKRPDRQRMAANPQGFQPFHLTW
jgi:hypothetical protein